MTRRSTSRLNFPDVLAIAIRVSRFDFSVLVILSNTEPNFIARALPGGGRCHTADLFDGIIGH